MTDRRTIRWALPLLAAGAAYAVWSRWGRGLPDEASPEACPLESVGENAGRGNLLGLQPRLAPADYASADRLFRRLDAHCAAARRAGVLNEKTVVLLPEHLGTWLAAAGEKAGVYRAASVREAMLLMAASNLPAFLYHLAGAREREWGLATVIRMKAAATAAGYHRIMSTLAQRYRAHIVAGSLLLPDPHVRNGVLCAGHGPLYNATPCYGPDGRVREPLVKKIYPVAEELPVIRAGCCEDLPVFPTPAGRLGILICADSWFPDCYEALRSQGVELIAVPSLSTDLVGMTLPWDGYSGAPPPADVDPADIGRLTRAQAWKQYALASRLATSGARAGMNIFYQGRLWEMQPAGRASAIMDGNVIDYGENAALVNLWL
ncbi:MAG: nitrilase-related carbon-nitrogen hydrolase [Armatimonadota bacterium]